ncbi:hypothetical protein Tco_1555222 [Tanacetum coccineum]
MSSRRTVSRCMHSSSISKHSRLNSSCRVPLSRHSIRYMRLAPRCNRLRWHSSERLIVGVRRRWRAGQPGSDARVPDHQKASRDANSRT